MIYHFKQLDIFEDFIYYQKSQEKNFEGGLVVIDCDLAALKSIDYLDCKQNIEYYMEHLVPGTRLKERLPDYCKSNILSKVQNMLKGHENRGQKTNSSTVLLLENTIVPEVVMSTGEKTPN